MPSAAPGIPVELALDQLHAHAPVFAALAEADPSLLSTALAQPLSHRLTAASLRRRLAHRLEHEGFDEALRKLRHRAMTRIVLREIGNLADLDETTAELSTLASVCLDEALRFHRKALGDRFGDALDADGHPIPLTALGMGKLGGNELNLGSDIDLMFFYGTDDGQVGDGLDLSVHEFFVRVVRAASRSVGEVTDHGFVFRVDHRLRPEGSRGPLANSLDSAERYYTSFGRDWERAALLRARPIAGNLHFGEELLRTLSPFVWRRQVDPGIAAAMHAMVGHAQRDLGADLERNIKLGRGGIRELEFFVQGLQLVWGGKLRNLQVPGTIDAIRRLLDEGLLRPNEAGFLEESWALLRRVEHRVQMLRPFQTHDLPESVEELRSLAHSLGYAKLDAFVAALGEAREGVHQLFDSLVEEPPPIRPFDALLESVAMGATGEELHGLLQPLAFRELDAAAVHLARAARRANSPFGPRGRKLRPELGALLLDEILASADPDTALPGVVDLCLRTSEGYHRLLHEDPRLRRRVVSLCGASRTLTESLLAHPEGFAEVLLRQPSHLPDDPETEADDVEAFVASLRRQHREVQLRLGLGLVAQELAGEDVHRTLSRLADQQLDRAASFALREMEHRYGRPDGATLATVGLGKLGSEELGFGSDLDLVFIYSAAGETEGPRSISHGEFFARVAQRTLRLLSQNDAEGNGWEVDTRLRPNGGQGMLVVSMAAFQRYHREKAMGWERQALLRARVVSCANDGFRSELDALFSGLAFDAGPTDPEELARLRNRMQGELAGESDRRYHPKLGFGGLMDVELATQWLQMKWGNAPAVRKRHTLRAIEGLREAGALSDDAATSLREGYLFFRRVEQSMRLLDPRGDATLDPKGPRANAVSRLMGLRARDGVPRSDVLHQEWQGHAARLRSHFESIVAPVGAPAPWGQLEAARP